MTLTAPSSRHCKKAGCSSPTCAHEVCPCSDDGFDLGEWNADHGRRWNHFRTRFVRELAGDGASYMRGCEVQDGEKRLDGVGRMALHDHFVVRVRRGLDEKSVRALAIACGFGHEVKVVPVVPGSKREAYYVSKYVVKSTDSRYEVPWLVDWVDLDTGEVTKAAPADGRARYRTWSCSRDWGLTLAAVRQADREKWLVHQAGIDTESEVSAMSVLGAAFGGGWLAEDVHPPPSSP